MDSAMDSQSTTSEHSIASSAAAESPTNHASLANHSKPPQSPTLNNNHYSNNSNASSTHPLNNNNHHNNNHLGLTHNPHHSGGGANNHNLLSSSSSCGGPNHPQHHGLYHLPHSNSSSQHRRTPTSVSPPPAAAPHRQHHPKSPSMNNGPHMMPMANQLSPPQVSTPNSMVVAMGGSRMSSAMGHLPPHGLGLLSSLQMMHHANPLELMAAAHHHVPPRSYNSPPPISTSDPTANECKLVDYRGQKVAAFIIAGDTMLCLPQAFELFLKHLVGGLHTVYTKLKRLDIVPLVCNVEQVRILRGLGAIQPGVNRCKLLSCKDFDILYRDCTTARCLSVKPPESSRPGRPPKRGSVGMSMPTSHLSHHPQLKKHRLENGDYAYENGHLSDMSRMEKSPLLANGYNPPPHLNHMQFMQMNHHPGAMMSPNMPPHGMSRGSDCSTVASAAMMKGQAGMPPGMDAIARSGIWENCRAAYEDIVKHLERLREERVDDRDHSTDTKPRDMSSRNGSPHGHSPILNLSKSGGLDHDSADERSVRSDVHSPSASIARDDEEQDLSDDNVSEVDEREEKDEDISDVEREDIQTPSHSSLPAQSQSITDVGRPETPSNHHQALNYSTLAATAAVVAASNNAAAAAAAVAAAAKSGNSAPASSASPNGHLHSNEHHHHESNNPNNLSSTETLLRNIQSLLTVAADNARQQERQISYEKAELKMDVLREREVKDRIERQFTDEQKLRVLYQRRYKKERRARVRIQQLLDMEQKRRNQMEDALRAAGAPPETLRPIAENQSNERRDRPSSTERHTDSPYSQSNRDRPPSSTSQLNQQQQQQQQHQQKQQLHHHQPQHQQPPLTLDGKPWNYPGLDLMASGAFWQNYSESLAQEIEIERQSRQQSGDRNGKSPLQDRQNYYKNSVLFSSVT